tara:strand:+ start:348 stop:740 length:393 start_codon:yes stop_codon:yes gene_type:complete
MTKFNLLKRVSIILVSGLLFVQCANDDDDIVSVKEISFATDIQPLLAASCTSCHSSDEETVTNFTVEGGIAYEGLLSEIGGVTPGNADTSVLMDRLNGIGTAQQMPTSSLLSVEEIKLFEQWITQGAKNN